MKKCDVCFRCLTKGEQFSKEAIANARVSEMSCVRVTVYIVGCESDICQTCLGRAASSAAVESRATLYPVYDPKTDPRGAIVTNVAEALDTTN